MDREIPLSERRRTTRRRWLRLALVSAAVSLTAGLAFHLTAAGVDAADLELAPVTRGHLQMSFSATGNVVPEYQQIIVSPLNTRIVEVYHRTGDELQEGDPLLKLDLQTAQTDYDRGLDDEQMRRLQLSQLRINQNTRLTDLAMKIEVSQMALNSKRMELRNECFLDSIGSGTTDRVRQAQLDFATAQLELEQLRKQYQNEQQAAAAEYKVQELDLQMFRKSLAQTKRTLDDARLRAPRKSVLTYINSSVGAQIAQGEQVAIVSDLGSFKAECSIADGYADRIAAGSHVLVRTAGQELSGIVSNLNPQTKNGMMEFTVRFTQPDHPLLRPGLKVEVYVLTAEKADVLRLRRGPYYQNAGRHRLFVVEGSRLVAREVTLGEASYDYVEVLSGLREGEQVAIGDMSPYANRNKLRIKQNQ